MIALQVKVEVVEALTTSIEKAHYDDKPRDLLKYLSELHDIDFDEVRLFVFHFCTHNRVT
jgi:hypothetical protein